MHSQWKKWDYFLEEVSFQNTDTRQEMTRDATVRWMKMVIITKLWLFGTKLFDKISRPLWQQKINKNSHFLKSKCNNQLTSLDSHKHFGQCITCDYVVADHCYMWDTIQTIIFFQISLHLRIYIQKVIRTDVGDYRWMGTETAVLTRSNILSGQMCFEPETDNCECQTDSLLWPGEWWSNLQKETINKLKTWWAQ